MLWNNFVGMFSGKKMLSLGLSCTFSIKIHKCCRKINCFKVTDLSTLHVLNKLILANNLARFSSHSSQQQTFDLSKSIKLCHRIFENKPGEHSDYPVIILHGLLGSKRNWASMANNMLLKLKSSAIFTVDLRNHGESPHTNEFSYELMASDVLKFMQDNSIEKASFIGHSMGGRVSMLLALRQPQLVQDLVVVDISPYKQSPDMMALPKLFEAVKSIVISPSDSISDARKKALQHLRQQNVDTMIANFLLTNLVEDPQKSTLHWQFNIKSISKNFETGIVEFPVLDTQFKGHTLFLSGGNSSYVKPEDEPEIKKYFPSAQFAYIKGAGHWVHAEKPDEFLHLVSSFLQEKR